VLFLLPWLDRSPVRSIRYRGMPYKVALGIFVVSFIALGYLGTQPATPVMTNFARLFSVLYFGFFISLLFIPKFEQTKPVPDRVTYK
jgi:ubiquinol-cytochrome c reductase cytochrome b subunit